MNFKINNKALTYALLEEAERLKIDIAPDYKPGYITLAYAIVNELGEEGREVFHRFCRLCTKYEEKHADKTYTSCLKSNRGGCGVGTIIWMCKDKGIDTDAVYNRLVEEQKRANVQNVQNVQPPFLNVSDESGLTEDADEVTCETDPKTPLPTFGKLDLPYPLNAIYARGQTAPQCDAVLVSALSVIGTAMDWHVCTKYSDVYQYPCLQLFVIAPAASGKGIMARTRQLADPLHEKRMGTYSTDYTRSMIAKNDWAENVKNRKVTPKPDDAVRQMFLIPGNNTGTGILQNIIESKGNGLIFEVEADTVSGAIKGDYGHWSDTLRKAFDHDRLSYNRRSNSEYKDLDCVRLGVVLSGTPGQLFPFIPSAENGLFSRQVFYYMPRCRQFISQFDLSNKRDNNTEFFDKLAGNFMNLLQKIESYGVLELRLKEEQVYVFNAHFSRVFHEAELALKGELDSTVFRQAVNAVRVMSIVAALREMENYGGSHLENAQRTVKDPYGSWQNLYYLEISDEDLHTVLGMFDVLYHHSIHILSFLKKSSAERRVITEKMLILKEMPHAFSRKEWLALCKERGIEGETADTWLKRMLKDGVLNKIKRGQYEKAA